MRKIATVTTLLLILAACGGGDNGGATDDTGAASGGTSASDGQNASSGGGNVVDPQPPGQARAVVDGQEYTFTEPGGVDCITPEAITFSFRIGDNEVTLGGGANLYDDGWLGGIDLTVFNPEGEDAPISYFPDLANNGDRIAVDGDSVSYSGPMQRNDPDDITNIDGIPAGDGTVSVTCG